MDTPPDLPESAVALIHYADAKPGSDEAQLAVETILAGSHPDFVMSLASASLMPPELRQAVSDFVRSALIDGLTQEQQRYLFSWAQRKMLAGP
jgi:hypothetical protein